jgi:8-oxo-dGTP pyrophosphatase MutT (NUDIX family)
VKQDSCHEDTAIRETFEETGILLADLPTGGRIDDKLLDEARKRIHAGKLSFPEFLKEHGLVMRRDLFLFTQWITPKNIPRQVFLLIIMVCAQLIGVLYEQTIPHPLLRRILGRLVIFSPRREREPTPNPRWWLRSDLHLSQTPLRIHGILPKRRNITDASSILPPHNRDGSPLR